MPEVECQTEMTLKTIEGMERHCAIHQILIKNNWTGKPEIEDSIALPFGCRLTKDDTERFLFRSFHALEGMELSVSDFKAIKHEFESGDESSKHPHWQESLRSCALRHYGITVFRSWSLAFKMWIATLKLDSVRCSFIFISEASLTWGLQTFGKHFGRSSKEKHTITMVSITPFWTKEIFTSAGQVLVQRSLRCVPLIDNYLVGDTVWNA